MANPNLRFVVFPTDDRALSGDVRAALDRVPAAMTTEAARERVQRELRQWYRSLVIHERDQFGAYPDDPTQVWYVYRDGRVRRQNEALERLYAALARARTTCAASERVIANANVAARNAGYGHPHEPVPPSESDVARGRDARR